MCPAPAIPASAAGAIVFPVEQRFPGAVYPDGAEIRAFTPGEIYGTLKKKKREADMGCYDRMRFRGTFRDCQRRVLEHAQEYLDDGRLHVVAAPGSGKTVLGLELIRRLGAPCLILSPTSAIRGQWGERLRDLFLDDPAGLDALFSEDLHDLKTVNSATYQALYAATQKGDADLIAGLRARDVRTVCLDEAHHLRNEWYRALETFLRDLDRDVTLICLTATPPYDAEGPEWRRYHAVCGEIDEEIFVPELVASGSLCPHQDYVLFNYPDENELATLRDHRDRASAALEAVGRLDALQEACGKLQSRDPDRLYDPPEALTALLTLLEHCGYAADRKRIRRLTGRRTLPPFGMQSAETALQYLLDGDLLSGEGREELAAVLKKHGVFEKGTVRLVLTDRLRRLLVGSAGKLESVARIARSELDAMGGRLRMLVLTDHIKKESLAGITQRERFADVSVTSIFETLRRAVPEARIGVLSGSLVILPKAAGLPGADIPGTEYRSVELSDAVQTVGTLLESGALQILVGTKALLGEGWDSPCVNTLVLASTVGSFVSSNQMRGRAMRVDPRDPRKTANIWHLATVAPDYLFEDSLPARAKAYMAQDENRLSSFDFDVLVRRFDAFMGPNDATGEIESGFERLTAIRPPFDAAGVERINREMLAAAAERDCVRASWQDALASRPVRPVLEARVPAEKRLPALTVRSGAPYALLAVLALGLIRPLRLAITGGAAALSFGMTGLLCAAAYGLFRGARQLLLRRSPVRSIQALGEAVCQTLCQTGQIEPAVIVDATARSAPHQVCLSLRGASVHDQNVFQTAVTELFSPIDDPRYVLVWRGPGGLRYDRAFACPAAIGRKREHVELLAANLKKTAGRFTPVYTRTDEGRRILQKCRTRSRIAAGPPVEKQYRLSDPE